MLGEAGRHGGLQPTSRDGVGQEAPRVLNPLWIRFGSHHKGGGQGPAASPGVGGEPDAWNIQEQSNFTKSFSYSGLDVDTSAQGNGGMSMPGAFSFLSGGAGVGDRTQSNMNASSDSGRRKSKKEEIFDKQLEMYQQERNSATPRGPARAI